MATKTFFYEIKNDETFAPGAGCSNPVYVKTSPTTARNLKTGRVESFIESKRVERVSRPASLIQAPATAPTNDSADATDKQITYLLDLGVNIPYPAHLTKNEASHLIDLAKRGAELDGTGYRYTRDLGL